MAAKKRASRLGRGLSSLMAKPVDVKPPAEEVEKPAESVVETADKVTEAVEKADIASQSASRGAQSVSKVEAVEVAEQGAEGSKGEVEPVKGEVKTETVVAEKVAEVSPVVEAGLVEMSTADEIIEADVAAEQIAAGEGDAVVQAAAEKPVEAEQSVVDEVDNAVEADGDTKGTGVEELGLQYIAVGLIVANRYQPRSEFDERALKGLSDSIRRDGLMQPIIVRRLSEGDEQGGRAEFELVAGERRWRAAQLAELDVIPAFVRELDDEQMAEWALIENLQREDLNPIERAEAFKRLAEVFELSHSEVAERVGVERATVTNHLRLLKLCEKVRSMLQAGELSMGQARALAGIEDEAVQLEMAKKAVSEAWSVRRMEMEVRKLGRGDAAKSDGEDEKKEEAKVRKAAYMADLEKHLSEQLSTKIKIRPGRKKGSGTLSIEFYSLDQFDDLCQRMGVKFE